MMEASGKSSDGRIVNVFGPGTDDKLVLRFWSIYKRSADASGAGGVRLRAEHFRDAMDRGGIVVFVIIEDGQAECVFGIETRKDSQGDYLNFLFIYGFAAHHIVTIITLCFNAWDHHRALMKLRQEGRMLIMGRTGWKRVLKLAGLEFIEERPGKYWVFEWERGKVQ